MTSFGAQIENPDQFMSTFKVKGQIYHRAGSLLPFSGENHKFLQLYFISDRNSELNARCEISPNIERTIVSQLQHVFHENNNLVRLFKTAIDLMPTYTHKIVISADKTPPGQHMRRYNAPTIDEVAIVMVGDQFLPRDIILRVSTTRATTKNRPTNNTFKKYKPIKALLWHSTCREKKQWKT